MAGRRGGGSRRGGRGGTATAGKDSSGQPKAAVAATGHNLTDETIAHHLRQIQPVYADMNETVKEAREAVASAKGSYRALLKNAKKDGGQGLVDAITEALRLNDGDHGEVRQKSELTRRVLTVMDSPLALIYATQGDLFDAAGPAAAHVNGSTDKAFAEGERAGREGVAFLSGNPYEDATPEHVSWASGWREGQAYNARGIKQGGGIGDSALSEAAH